MLCGQDQLKSSVSNAFAIISPALVCFRRRCLFWNGNLTSLPEAPEPDSTTLTSGILNNDYNRSMTQLSQSEQELLQTTLELMNQTRNATAQSQQLVADLVVPRVIGNRRGHQTQTNFAVHLWTLIVGDSHQSVEILLILFSSLCFIFVLPVVSVVQPLNSQQNNQPSSVLTDHLT